MVIKTFKDLSHEAASNLVASFVVKYAVFATPDETVPLVVDYGSTLSIDKNGYIYYRPSYVKYVETFISCTYSSRTEKFCVTLIRQ